jgi:cell division protein DivIC
VTLRKIIIGLYATLFIVLAVMAAGFFWQARQELGQLRLQEARQKARLDELQVRLAEQERILRRLREDPAYVERVIRRRLLYARPDEMVFRFED